MLFPPVPAPLSVSAVEKAMVPTAELLWNCLMRRDTRPVPILMLWGPFVLVTDPLTWSVLLLVMSGMNVASPRLAYPAGFIGVSAEVMASMVTFLQPEGTRQTRAVV